MSQLFSIAAIRAIEAAWLAALPPGTLMRRAAAAVADAVIAQRARAEPAPVIVLAGPGNNGGDALLAGQILQSRGVPVVPMVVPELLDGPPAASDAARVWAQWSTTRLRPLAGIFEVLGRYPEALLVDGLFGIGLARPIRGPLAELIDGINATRARVLAIDVPSGLDADRGVAVGDGALLRAESTVTMIGDKPGLHTASGRAAAGRVIVAALREPVAGEPSALPALTFPAGPDTGDRGTLLTAQTIQPLIPWRDDDAHKGRQGDVLVVGGRLGMAGAARLAARGAIAGGAGRVLIAGSRRSSETDTPIDPGRPEIMRRAVAASGPLVAGRATVLVAGCGLGRDAGARRWTARVLATDAIVVLDADALNLVASVPALRRVLAARRARGCATVLTPHPLEAARLLDGSVATIAADRVAAARTLARLTASVVVLKGAGSIIANADGEYAVNDSGHPVLATGGSGDVLAGLIGALAASLVAAGDVPEYAAARAACVGVWLHGAAGQWLSRCVGPFGVPAGAIADAVPRVLAGLLNGATDGAQPA